MAHITERDLEMRRKLQEAIDRQDNERGRPLTDRERLENLRRALDEPDNRS